MTLPDRIDSRAWTGEPMTWPRIPSITIWRDDEYRARHVAVSAGFLQVHYSKSTQTKCLSFWIDHYLWVNRGLNGGWWLSVANGRGGSIPVMRGFTLWNTKGEDSPKQEAN